MQRSEILTDQLAYRLFFFAVVSILFFLFTNKFNERCVWWLAIAPIGNLGLIINGFSLSIANIISCLLIVEFGARLMVKNYSLSLNAVVSLMILAGLSLSLLISLVLSPLSGLNWGPFLKMSLLMSAVTVVLFEFSKSSNLEFLTKGVAYQIPAWILFVLIDGLFNIYSGTFFEWSGLSTTSPRLVYSNVFAYNLISAGPFIFMIIPMRMCIRSLLTVLILLTLLILSMSRAAYLVLICDLLFLVWIFIKRKKYKLALCFLGVGSVVFSSLVFVYIINISDVRSLSNSERLTAAKAHLEAWNENPTFGVGFGQWIRIHELGIGGTNVFTSDRYNQNTVSMNPHNVYIRLLSDGGLLSFCLFILFILFLFSICINNRPLRNDVNVTNFDYYMYYSTLMALMNQVVMGLFTDSFENQMLWSIILVSLIFALARRKKRIKGSTTHPASPLKKHIRFSIKLQ